MMITTISRLWRAHGLKPHQIAYFKVSTDPDFVAKLRDVVGLYMHPPKRAVVFSFDEKSQIQALDRTQPGLPLKKGRAGTLTHDYRRHGTKEAKGLSIHVILDNYATHKTPEVEHWLRRHPRVHFHFTPTSASWLNLVERFFSELTTRQLRRLAVTSLPELIAAITRYRDHSLSRSLAISSGATPIQSRSSGLLR